MKTVVILSPPRSGSSLLSGILHKLGVNMGKEEDLVRAKYLNKNGCYENRDFLSLNINILARADSIIFPAKIPNYEKIKKEIKKSNSNIRKLIKKYEKPLWGWKDPSTTFTISCIHEFLKNPYYIYLKRDCDSIIKSHIRLSGLGGVFFGIKNYSPLFKKSTLIRLGLNWVKTFLTKSNVLKNKGMIKKTIIEYDKQIEKFIKGKKHLTLTFNSLIKNSRKVIKLIVSFLNIKPSKEQLDNALSFVNPKLVHF